MNILNIIKEDLVKERRKSGKNIPMISTVLSEVSMLGKSNGDRETTDREALSVIKKMVKNNNATIAMVSDDRSVPYEVENLYLNKFLPKEVSDDEIKLFISELVNEINSPSKKDMGSLMTKVKLKFNGNYDGKKVSVFVIQALS